MYMQETDRYVCVYIYIERYEERLVAALKINTPCRAEHSMDKLLASCQFEMLAQEQLGRHALMNAYS